MAKPRILAPISLILAALLFSVTLPFRDIFAVGLLHAFGEAAMIGGLADWFAVVALFRHPMGIPIPHTAILPKHRAKLTQSIVDVLENNWLNKQSILVRIQDWQLFPSIMEYLSSSERRKAMLEMLKQIALNVVKGSESASIADRLSVVLQYELTEERLLLGLRKAGDYAVSSGVVAQMLPPALESGKKWCSSDEAREMVTELAKQATKKYANAPLKQLGVSVLEFVKVIDYAKLSSAILSAVEKELEAAQTDEEHALRKSIETAIAEYLASMESNPELKEAVGNFRRSMSEEGKAPEWLRELTRDAMNVLESDLEKDDPALMQYLDQLLELALEKLAASPDAMRNADAWIKEKIGELVESYHSEIGNIVKDNLSNLDDRELVQQIESKVGDDLQFIRLNGAIVGGTVGAIIFLLKQFVF
jgi:uncharacterized membrane-anchored protein YjiN (DUF445 family)